MTITFYLAWTKRMIYRREQLKTLISSLHNLIQVLESDIECNWTTHFQTCLDSAINLEANGFTQDDLNSLSSRVTYVYGGMGSFNDYVPLDNGGRMVAGFAGLCGVVYENAVQLRVIGSY